MGAEYSFPSETNMYHTDTVEYKLHSNETDCDSVTKVKPKVLFSFKVAEAQSQVVFLPGSLKVFSQAEPNRMYYLHEARIVHEKNLLPCKVNVNLTLAYKTQETEVLSYCIESGSDSECAFSFTQQLHPKGEGPPSQESIRDIFGFKHVIDKAHDMYQHVATQPNEYAVQKTKDYSQIDYFKNHKGFGFTRDSYLPYRIRKQLVKTMATTTTTTTQKGTANAVPQGIDTSVYKYSKDNSIVTLNPCTVKHILASSKEELKGFKVLDMNKSKFSISINEKDEQYSKENLLSFLANNQKKGESSEVVCFTCTMEFYSVSANPDFFNHHFPIKLEQ